MCREGVNLTQFKLALNHLIEEIELSQKGVSQWQVVLNSGSLQELKSMLVEAEKSLSETANKLKNALKKASELALSDIDGVEITPL